MSRRIVGSLLLFAGLTGCNMFPQGMRPANWWKLNAQDPPSNESMYFSVPDPDSGDPFLERSNSPTRSKADEVTFGELGSAGR